MKMVKTNAMRILDKENIPYQELLYDVSDGLIDGASVCAKVGLPAANFFKTLVAQGVSKAYYVFVVPAMKELDMKKAAKSVNEKAISLIPVKSLPMVTGYIRGGCSPVGMKKHFVTVYPADWPMDATVYVSGGKKGCVIGVHGKSLLFVTGGITADVIAETV